ncbi:MAG: 50S ribosomal protein L13, partial [Candidatus Kuenenbacteria bacterium]
MTEKIIRKEHIIDATNIALGRLASKIAQLLRGKHKVNFTPHLDQGDGVAVENIDHIKITGNKMAKKIYYRHSMYPGGLKETKMKDLAAQKGMAELLRKAVYGMLPANRLRKGMM